MAGPRVHTSERLVPGQQIVLDKAASRHLAGALRLRTGDSLTLFNGGGGEYLATIISVERKHVTVELETFSERCVESPLRLHLGVGVSRGERMDWVIQKSTELGVAEISPLLTAHTEVKLSADRADKKLHHWQQIAISACEQCGRNSIPQINPLQPYSAWCRDVEADVKLVLHPRGEYDQPLPANPGSVALLSGPEGGFAAAEIETAEQCGFHSLVLGRRVLRTETAPLAALAILQSRWGDMG